MSLYFHSDSTPRWFIVDGDYRSTLPHHPPNSPFQRLAHLVVLTPRLRNVLISSSQLQSNHPSHTSSPLSSFECRHLPDCSCSGLGQPPCALQSDRKLRWIPHRLFGYDRTHRCRLGPKKHALSKPSIPHWGDRMRIVIRLCEHCVGNGQTGLHHVHAAGDLTLFRGARYALTTSMWPMRRLAPVKALCAA